MKIIKFSSNFCGTCRKLDAILEIANLVPDEYKVITDNELEIAKKYNVASFPTLIKFNDKGEEIARITGLISLSRLKDFFEK